MSAGTHGEPVALFLGSNIGNRKGYLELAKKYLETGGVVRVSKSSSVYETEPVDAPVQPYFLNQVILVDTGLEPGLLLAHCKRVESLLGRLRGGVVHGPRTIDIDILFFGSRVIKTPLLTIPHHALHGRRCVLVPLAEVAPRWVHPVLKACVSAMLESCADQSAVRLVLPELED